MGLEAADRATAEVLAREGFDSPDSLVNLSTDLVFLPPVRVWEGTMEVFGVVRRFPAIDDQVNMITHSSQSLTR